MDMRRKKAIGDDNIPEELLKELERHGETKLTELLNIIYQTS